ncbi:MAG: N-acetyl-gamma-glutamyl-phosphate reductase [Polyangiaceae bacterium]
MQRVKAAIIGGSGYGGGEMIRRLLNHPSVELSRVASLDYVGEPLASAHPNLEGQTTLRFEKLPPKAAAEGMDVVLLGLPHKVSAEVMPELLGSKAKIVDMSGDFRLKDATAYAKYYGKQHPCPELFEQFVYGLPELNRERIRQSRCVASPGCFATTIELALLPFARRSWLRAPVEVVAMTGSSGSGVVASAGTHHPVRSNNIKTYKTLNHQHMPEILETLQAAGAAAPSVAFVPVSAPLARGIFATCFVSIPEAVQPEQVLAALHEDYDAEPFVRVPQTRLPEVVAVAGSNFAEIGAVVEAPRNGQRLVAVFSATDNLIKGGAGQAIQNMNLVLGIDERAGLEDPGSYP